LGLSLLSLGVLLCTVLCSHPLRQLNPCSALPPPWPQVVVLLDGNGFEVPQTSFSGGSGSGAERSGQAAVASGSGSTSSTASSSGGSSGSGGLSGGAIAGIVVGGECVGLLGAGGCQQAFCRGDVPRVEVHALGQFVELPSTAALLSRMSWQLSLTQSIPHPAPLPCSGGGGGRGGSHCGGPPAAAAAGGPPERGQRQVCPVP